MQNNRVPSRLMLTVLLIAAAWTTVAASACWKVGTAVSCCSLVSTFDGVGNCSPWFHSCPDVAISNPMAQQVFAVGQNQGGQVQKSPTPLNCSYQPKKCNFIGCSNDGPIANGGCLDEVPSGAGCPQGPPV